MKRTIIYTRQSTSEKNQPNSKELQTHTCLKMAEQNNWVVHEIMHDEVSARTKSSQERKMLTQLLLEVEAGTVERIIVFKRDRIARRAHEYMEIIKLLKEHEVELCFSAANEPPIMPGMISDFLEYILAGMAQLEGNAIHDRKIQSRKIKARDGFWAGGSPPFGYISQQGVLSIDKQKVSSNLEESTKKEYSKADLVGLLFKGFIELWSVNERLDEILTKMKNHPKAVEWKWKDLNIETLQSRLSNRLYRGQLMQKIEGTFLRTMGAENRERIKSLALIEKETWLQANSMLSKTLSLFPLEEKEVINPLFSGLVYCGLCYRPMETKTKYYSCENTECTRRKFQVQIKTIDQSLKKRILDYWESSLDNNSNNELFQRLKVVIIQKCKEEMEQKKSKLQKAESNLIEAYLNENRKVLTDALRNYEGTLIQWKQECEKYELIQKGLDDLLLLIVGHYQSLSFEKREDVAIKIVGGLAEKVLVFPSKEFSIHLHYNLSQVKGNIIGSE
ncbi:recombinase family protein [Bacillus pinisoli]|uniref:recombinase family protein n=1 Tax=Bacillus pinisoli TaxID=2901866 RepID=UPI001FF1C102|nr:recombinase family protein [Bacillus pinisoli]